MDNEEFKPEEALENFAHNTEEKAQEISGDIEQKAEEAAEAVSEGFSDVIEEAAESAEDLKEEAETAADKAAETAESAAEDAAETFGFLFEETKEKAEEAAEAAAEDLAEAAEEFKGPIDELEKPVGAGRREPSIPQYVPKTYERPKAEEASETFTGMDDETEVDVLEPVSGSGSGIKGSLGGKKDEKSSKTVLWIILAILVCLCIGACCLIQALMAFFRFIASL